MSGAAAATLASLLGNNHIMSVTSDTNGDGVADLTRNYTSFSNMSAEALMSGVYAGINFKTSNVDGNALGAVVGQFVNSNPSFAPVPEPSSAFYVLAVGLFLIMKRRNRQRA
jgi:predicted MFS family arabinose efflux permease